MVMVLEPYRRSGVGRWLVGHAIGVAESRGGRQLLALLAGPGDFLPGLGFQGQPNDYRFEMIPE
jgi:GNAT superfamily N-acetyltransferase